MANIPLDAVTKNRAIENNQKNAARQAAALKRTLEELALVEALDKKSPGAYTSAIQKIRGKRDRQHANLQATEQYLAALRG